MPTVGIVLRRNIAGNFLVKLLQIHFGQNCTIRGKVQFFGGELWGLLIEVISRTAIFFNPVRKCRKSKTTGSLIRQMMTDYHAKI